MATSGIALVVLFSVIFTVTSLLALAVNLGNGESAVKRGSRKLK